MKRISSLLLILLTLLLAPLAAQEPEKPAAEAPPKDAAAEQPPFSAALLLIKADWSKVPAAKEIEAELREALKDAEVPKELMDKLPASGPQILFAPETVAFYSLEHAAELLEWLQTKGLVVGTEPMPLGRGRL